MEKNMGGMDALIREAIGFVLAVLYFTDVVKGTTGIVLFLTGSTLVLTSLQRFCPIYFVLGLHHKQAGKNSRVKTVKGFNPAHL